MASIKSSRGTSFSITATHATLASASQAGVTGSKHYITNITVSSDKAGSVGLVKKGTTVIWQFVLGAGVHSVPFDTELRGDISSLVSVEIDGTALCTANISGFTI